MPEKESVVPIERIERMIVLIRGQKVMLDADLAELYGVPTKALNQAVKRNTERFPSDFMFTLSSEEKKVVELERKTKGHDEKIRSLVGAIRQLMTTPENKPTRIGFSAGEK